MDDPPRSEARDATTPPVQAEPPAQIDSSFRAGTMTAVSVMLGFSLSFMNRWASLPGDWTRLDLVAVAFILVGTGFQIVSLVRLLAVESIIVEPYNRAKRIFLAGLILVVFGVFLAVFADILGHGQRVLLG